MATPSCLSQWASLPSVAWTWSEKRYATASCVWRRFCVVTASDVQTHLILRFSSLGSFMVCEGTQPRSIDDNSICATMMLHITGLPIPQMKVNSRLCNTVSTISEPIWDGASLCMHDGVSQTRDSGRNFPRTCDLVDRVLWVYCYHSYAFADMSMLSED